MDIWVITDTHFGHNNIIKYCGRPQNHEELILDNLKCVSEDDILIHLGDFCIGRDAYWHERFMSGVKGKKWLILGNHDRKSFTWYNRYWDFVGNTIELNMFNKHVILTHKPLDHTGDFLNIHGHIHNDVRFVGNVCNKLIHIENNFKPFKLRDIVEGKV